MWRMENDLRAEMRMTMRQVALLCAVALLSFASAPATVAGEVGSFTCPDVELSEAQLTEIIQQARAVREDLPRPFDSYKILVGRVRCLYAYSEVALPADRGDYQTFMIDPYGEIIEVQTGNLRPGQG